MAIGWVSEQFIKKKTGLTMKWNSKINKKRISHYNPGGMGADAMATRCFSAPLMTMTFIIEQWTDRRLQRSHG